ncbi:MAG: MerR family transcriptional regulator [Microbacteriaceae bacterium]|nr:MerR family transcriptional regulator [Microbacteriaceae bacterium]
MRVSDCAELAGTTVRAIRHYHATGLLPVPERRGGRRDYGLEHIARLLRIRWLAEAGMPLEQVRTVLDEEVDAPAELAATAAQLDARIAELREQRARIDSLLDVAASGGGLRALPPGLARFYRRLAATIDDPVALEVLRREERFAEMFAQRGLVPSGFDALVDALPPDDLAVVVDFYSRFGRLDETSDPADVDALVADMTAWGERRAALVREFVDALPAWSRSSAALRPFVGLTRLFAYNRAQNAAIGRLLPIVERALDEAGARAGTRPHPDPHHDPEELR